MVRLVRSLIVSVCAASIVAVPAGSASAGVPAFSSRPEAPHVLYLDFDGHVEQRSPYTCRIDDYLQPEGWSLEVTSSDVSGYLQPGVVEQIWDAVAEDYAPFHVNVTTDPAYEPADDYHTDGAVRVAIGRVSIKGDGLGYAPAVCDREPPYTNPRIANVVFVRFDGVSGNPRQIAQAASHEAGHIYGLLHSQPSNQGTAAIVDNWIMEGYDRADRHLWQRGPDENGQLQDDVATIGRVLPLVPDEPATPRSLSAAPPTISLPRRLYTYGVLNVADDVDEFRFRVSGEGRVAFRGVPGTFADRLATNPPFGSEANTRHRFVVTDAAGRVVLACPEGYELVLNATSQQTIGPPNRSCATHPHDLLVGSGYRIRVTQHPSDNGYGHIGRYTLLVDGPVQPDGAAPSARP